MILFHLVTIYLIFSRTFYIYFFSNPITITSSLPLPLIPLASYGR